MLRTAPMNTSNSLIVTAVLGLGLLLFGSFSPALFPPTWQISLAYLGAILLALGGIGSFIRHFAISKSSEYLHLWSLLGIRKAGWLPFRRAIPIRDAARIAYEVTRDSTFAAMAERTRRDHALEILGAYASAFYDEDRPEIWVFGKRPPSTRYEVVPHSMAAQLWFNDEVTGLKQLGGANELRYTDVAVTKLGLKRLIKIINGWG